MPRSLLRVDLTADILVTLKVYPRAQTVLWAATRKFRMLLRPIQAEILILHPLITKRRFCFARVAFMH